MSDGTTVAEIDLAVVLQKEQYDEDLKNLQRSSENTAKNTAKSMNKEFSKLGNNLKSAFNVNIDSKEASKKIKSLENQIEKLQEKYNSTNATLADVYARQDQVADKIAKDVTPNGVDSSKIEEFVDKQIEANSEYKALNAQAIKLQATQDKYDSQLKAAKAQLAELNSQYGQENNNQSKANSKLTQMKSIVLSIGSSIKTGITNAFSKVGNTVKSLGNKLKNIFKKIGQIGSKITSMIPRSK